MRNAIYKVLNALVRLIPGPILWRMLRAMHHHMDIADRVGYTVYPQAFYSPFPIPHEIDVVQLKSRRSLPGVHFNLAEAKTLLRELARYSAEAKEFLKDRPADSIVNWGKTYPDCDTTTLYAMLRHLKPKRYVEVGLGYSSKCSTAALQRNQMEGNSCQCTFIEPYPGERLGDFKLPGEFIKEMVQKVPLERFTQLEAGDVLFIDTSHILKVQNDVEYELIHILPSLKPGVLVHIHDIFSPYDYPEEWLLGTGPQRGAANEQYALECLLSGGGDWEVVLPVYLLWREHRELLAQVVDSTGRPAAFWIRKLRKSPIQMV